MEYEFYICLVYVQCCHVVSLTILFPSMKSLLSIYNKFLNIYYLSKYTANEKSLISITRILMDY